MAEGGVNTLGKGGSTVGDHLTDEQWCRIASPTRHPSNEDINNVVLGAHADDGEAGGTMIGAHGGQQVMGCTGKLVNTDHVHEVHVPQAINSDSTTLKGKKGDLYQRLIKLKEQEKYLKTQLTIQRERTRLEQQEKQNQRLEADLQRQQECEAFQHQESERIASLEDQRFKIKQARKAQELAFKLEKEKLLAK